MQCAEASRSISDLSVKVDEELVPKFNSKLQDMENESKVIQYDLRRNKAPKMDSLLADSDQLLTKVSTTYNLEIRKLGERLDKIEADTPGIKWLWKLGYGILEWVLVLLMWLAWSLVSVLRLGRGTFNMVFV